jgi:phage shock protein A
MDLGKRMGSKVRAVLGTALAAAPDPRQTSVTPFDRQRGLLAQVAEAAAQVAASKDRLRERLAEVQARLPDLREQAKVELREGRRELARVTLQRHQVASVQLQMLEDQIAEVEVEEAALTLIERRLAAEMEALVARQDLILARYSAAEANVRIKEAVTGVSKEFEDLASALRQAEDRTQTLEARATAIERLVHQGMLDVSLAEEARGTDLEEQLDALLSE